MVQISDEDFYKRGVEKVHQGDFEGAISDFTQAIRLNPNNAQAYYNLGLARFQPDQDDEDELEDTECQAAIQDLTLAIGLNPNYAEAYYLRGRIYWYLGETEPEDALEEFNQAIRLNPNYMSPL